MLKTKTMDLGLRQRFDSVHENIARAAERSGRPASEITLVAVTKKFSIAVIEEAYKLGHRDFAENRPQEMRDKVPQLPVDIKWHFVGHLQSNKIKYVLPPACLVHSVDSEKKAHQIARFAEARSLKPQVLLEIHNGVEESKSGIPVTEAAEQCLRIYEEKRISVKGLMVMAPLSDDEKLIRPVFKKLRELRDTLRTHAGAESFPWLSMGMTNDYQWAIEEGSTHVRIGTALFGPRRRKSETDTG